MSWASYIPKELEVTPQPLVVLTGLDIKHNAVHKEIWDGFNARNNQKFFYKLLDGDHEYPKCKNKRAMEFYMPKGIFKTNWFHKHINLVPSLVVVFFDLDWDEPNWKEKHMECATKVELVRHSLADRNTRIILVLIQKHPSIPIDGDNVLARERYPALCNACSIKNNYLFLLHTELLHGYIAKLEEDAFTEPTQTYYTLEIKSIKLKRDSLIKVTHQYLLVRLAIKIAFFNEIRSDVFKAIEYYKQAYLSALDIRFYDTNLLEIKMVAGMINYKLCKLFFEIKHPIDAIDQFRKHIDIFKIKVGPAELSFEHSAWVSKQFQVMGELFENAIDKGYLSAVQTQHPGFYFHSAANHAIQRRLNAKDFLRKQFNMPVWSSENPSPIENLNNLEFYGQRPWRQGQGMEILDQQKERDGILCLQELESRENLTPLITNLFKQAITHFQVFHCKRMKQFLSVCMAEEFYYAKDYQESLNIYVKVLNDYNNEHWWPIITSIMLNALKCAYLIADITNYCLLCMEIIGKNILLSVQEKSLIQQNLLRVLSNETPIGEYHQLDTNLHSIEEANEKWRSELNRTDVGSSATASSTAMDTSLILAAHKIIPAHVSGMVPFVESKIRFSSRIYNSNQNCELFVYLRTNCPDVIQFDKLYVRFNLPHYNQFCLVENKDRLLFEPNRIYNFRFQFWPNTDDTNKELEVNSISLELGNRDVRVLVMHWRSDCKNALAHENHTINTIARLSSLFADPHKNDLSAVGWNEINVVPMTSIVARKSNIELKLEHNTPIFVDEYYPIRLTVENKEEKVIENLKLSVELQPISNSSSEMAESQVISLDAKLSHVWIGSIEDKSNLANPQIHQTKSLPNIEPNNKFTDMIFVQIKQLKAVDLIVKVKYDVNVIVKALDFEEKNDDKKQSSSKSTAKDDFEPKEKISCSCVNESRLKLESIDAFKSDFFLMSTQMKPIKTVRYGEPFLILCEITNRSPYSIKFKNSNLKLNNRVKFKKAQNDETKEESQQSFLKEEILKPNEMATECYCLMIEQHDEDQSTSLNLGEYLIEWRRKSPQVKENSAGFNENDDDEDEEEPNSAELDHYNIKTKHNLPDINIEPFPILIDTIVPTYGTLDKELRLTYVIKNKLKSQPLDIECILDENEFFSISGKKLELMQIMPNDSINFTFAAFPLQIGYCKLPNFQIKLNNFNVPSGKEAAGTTNTGNQEPNANLESVIQNMLPSQIFIFPQNIDSLLESKS